MIDLTTIKPRYQFNPPLAPAMQKIIEPMLQDAWERVALPWLEEVLFDYEEDLVGFENDDIDGLPEAEKAEINAKLMACFKSYVQQYESVCERIADNFRFPDLLPEAIQNEVAVSLRNRWIKHKLRKAFSELKIKHLALIGIDHMPHPTCDEVSQKFFEKKIDWLAFTTDLNIPAQVAGVILSPHYDAVFVRTVTDRIYTFPEAAKPLYRLLFDLVKEKASQERIHEAIYPWSTESIEDARKRNEEAKKELEEIRRRMEATNKEREKIRKEREKIRKESIQFQARLALAERKLMELKRQRGITQSDGENESTFVASNQQKCTSWLKEAFGHPQKRKRAVLEVEPIAKRTRTADMPIASRTRSNTKPAC